MARPERPDAPRPAELERRAERLRARAWTGYLVLCRSADAGRYERVEADAWHRLRRRLTMVDEELERARERVAVRC